MLGHKPVHRRCFLVLAMCLPAMVGVVRAQQKPSAAPVTPPAPPVVARETKTRPDIVKFQARVEAALTEARADKGTWGVLVTDAATGEPLYALNPQRYFVPASNTKLFTSALAITTLGPDFRFRTSIEAHGVLGADGRLAGDLVLIGRGDPNLSNRKFPYAGKVERDGPTEKILAELADTVVSRGVSQIAGDIVADDTYFAFDPYPPGWEIDDMPFGYGAPVSAIAVNDNTLSIEVSPGQREGDAAWITVEPWAGYQLYAFEITTTAAGSKLKFDVVREPGSRLLALRGSIPLDHTPVKLDLAVDDPAEFAARLLKRLLEARGIRVYGQARARHAPPPDSGAAPSAAPPNNTSNPSPMAAASGPAALGSATPGTAPAGSPAQPLILAEHFSPPLIECARLLLKISQNLHAELLLRAAAREKTGEGSLAAGLKLEQDFLKAAGIDEGDVVINDGSGLSRGNLVTPQAVVKLLQYVAQQPWAEGFRSALPIAAQDGTLEQRLKDTSAASRIFAKTGTLEHANALSGFATTVNGEKLIFSMFGSNNAMRSRGASSVLDAICLAMIEELGVPPRASAPARGVVPHDAVPPASPDKKP